MTTTPILGMTDLTSGQSIPESSVNEHDRILEWFAAGAAIEDRDEADPTAITPADGEAWLIAASATGTWSGKDGNLALYVNTGWLYFMAKEGMRIWVKDEDKKSTFDGSAWVDETPGGAGLTAATDTDIWTGTSATKAITPDALFDASKFQTLTDGVTITPDFGAGLNFKVTLGGNRTLDNPSNAKDGQSGVIRVIQDGTGTRTLTYGSNWRFPGGSATGGVLSTAAGSIDIIAYIVDEGGLIHATLSKAFAA